MKTNAILRPNITLNVTIALLTQHLINFEISSLQVTAALAHVNVKTLFRKSLLKNTPLTHDNVPKVWQEVSGERMEKQKLAEYIAKFKLAPVALEILLIKDLVTNKILQALTPK